MSYNPRHAAERPAQGVEGASVGSGLPGSGGVPTLSRRTARVARAARSTLLSSMPPPHASASASPSPAPDSPSADPGDAASEGLSTARAATASAVHCHALTVKPAGSMDHARGLCMYNIRELVTNTVHRPRPQRLELRKNIVPD